MCGAKTAGFSIEVQNPAPQGEKFFHWLNGGEWDALLLDYSPRNSPHAAMVQPASEMECLILVAAGVRMRLSLTTIKSCDWT